MNGWRRFAFVLLLCVGSLPEARAAFVPELLGPTFRAELDNPSRLTAEQRARAAGFDYLFVGGIMGEYVSRFGYFADLRRGLLDLGIPNRQTHLLFPSSARTVEENAEALKEELERITAHSPRKLVIVAHSKGAVELLGFVLANPEFVERKIEAIVFLQGAFGGSPVANHVMRVPQPTADLSFVVRFGMSILGRAGRLFFARIKGVAGLTTDAAEERLREWRVRYEQAIPRVAERLLFVQTWTSPELATRRLAITARFIAAVDDGNPSDGTVPLAAQRAAGFGDNFEIFEELDHSFPCSRMVSGHGPHRKHAFARALANSVGR